MGTLAGLVKHDLASASQQDRRRSASSSSTSSSKASSRTKASSSHHSHHLDPATTQELHRVLASMERAPHDRRLAATGLRILRGHAAANEPGTHDLLLRPEALRVQWDAAHLHATTGDNAREPASDAVVEAFLATLLCLTEDRNDRARVRRALPAYAPHLVSRLRTRVDRGSAGARALEAVARRIGVGVVVAA